MFAQRMFNLASLSEEDILPAIQIYHAAEIATREAKGESFSRPQRRRGARLALDHYKDIFKETVAVNDPVRDRLKGGFNNRKLAGYAWYGECPTEQQKTYLGRLLLPKYGCLKHLFVDAAHQGQGLGRLLFQVATYELREAGFSKMRLITEQVNEGARKLYERLGGQTNDNAAYRDDYGEIMIEYTWKLTL